MQHVTASAAYTVLMYSKKILSLTATSYDSIVEVETAVLYSILCNR
jgi:hypothetical protein